MVKGYNNIVDMNNGDMLSNYTNIHNMQNQMYHNFQVFNNFNNVSLNEFSDNSFAALNSKTGENDDMNLTDHFHALDALNSSNTQIPNSTNNNSNSNTNTNVLNPHLINSSPRQKSKGVSNNRTSEENEKMQENADAINNPYLTKMFNNDIFNNFARFNSGKNFEDLNKKFSNLGYFSTDYNIEIPVNFRQRLNYNEIAGNFQQGQSNENMGQNMNLSNFLESFSTPTLYIDLTSPNYQLELKIKELESHLQSVKSQISEYKDKIPKLDKEIELNSKKLKDLDKDLNYVESISMKNEQEIAALYETKRKLLEQIPEEKISHKSNKDLNQEDYFKLKFYENNISEEEVLDTLQKDLIEFQMYNDEVMNRKMNKINRLIGLIKHDISEIFPEYEAKVYGSFATGLTLPWSELDIVLSKKDGLKSDQLTDQDPSSSFLEKNVAPHFYENQSSSFSDFSNPNFSPLDQRGFNKGKNMLLLLREKLSNKTWLDNKFQVFEMHSVQILKYKTSQEFDFMLVNFSFDSEKHNGIRCVDLIQSYLKEYPVLRPIVLALKNILKYANLNTAYLGGLSSYGLILMIVSFIQSKLDKYNSTEDGDNKNLVAKAFYGFLYHYGIYFDFSKYFIVTYNVNEIKEPNIEKDSFSTSANSHHELLIIDPLNKENNVAASCFQFMNLKMAFIIAYMVAKEECDCGCHYGRAVYEHTMKSAEHCILKRMFNSVKRYTDAK